MKLIIAGSRTFNDFETDFITNLVRHYNLNVSEVVCGCGSTSPLKTEECLQNDEFVSSEGIDLLGEFWSYDFDKKIRFFPPNWDYFGKKAGPYRNKDMAEYSDALLLIWDGKSPGSRNMKREMEKLNKPIYEVILK